MFYVALEKDKQSAHVQTDSVKLSIGRQVVTEELKAETKFNSS